MVKLLVLTLAAAAMTAPSARAESWDQVASLAPGAKIEVLPQERSAARVKGELVSVTADALSVRARTGEFSWRKAEIRMVKVLAPGRRTRNGLIGLAIGAGAGFAAGELVCIYCRNEGHSGFGAIGLAAGAGIGALAFLPAPYQTIYKAPRK